jgi:hypothetical protein
LLRGEAYATNYSPQNLSATHVPDKITLADDSSFIDDVAKEYSRQYDSGINDESDAPSEPESFTRQSQAWGYGRYGAGTWAVADEAESPFPALTKYYGHTTAVDTTADVLGLSQFDGLKDAAVSPFAGKVVCPL